MTALDLFSCFLRLPYTVSVRCVTVDPLVDLKGTLLITIECTETSQLLQRPLFSWNECIPEMTALCLDSEYCTSLDLGLRHIFQSVKQA